MCRWMFSALCFCCIAVPSALASAVLIDFDMTGRPLAEVNEPGYTSWSITETNSASLDVAGIRFSVSRYGSAGSAIKTDWHKASVQAPNYARITGDGLTVVNGNSGGAIQLTISGLPAGTHTLLAYHNTTNGYDHAPLSVSVNGVTQISRLLQTNRATTLAAAARSFISFSVTAGQTVNVVYASDASSSSGYRNVVINALGLNVADPSRQVSDPLPAHRDFHVNADAGSLLLSWAGPTSGADAYHVFLGTDSAAVASATPSSSAFLGTQTETSRKVSGLSSHHLYYWRVDALQGAAATRGDVWFFGPRQLAFPGAEGYGRFARGGRGGKVIRVTNLDDSGPGSLREAVENDVGPRTIVFDVGGIITLKSRLTLTSHFVTIAGQTAPGKGVVIRGAPFGFSGVQDGIMRFMRIRLGAGPTFDGTGLQGSDHCIFDHNSVSWTIDESFSSRSGKNITLQRTMLAEALNAAGHQNYPAGTKHGYAATISGDVGSFHHNLLAHNEGRNWSLGGGLDGDGYFAGRLDIFNNVVYNWGGRTTDGGAHQVNFVNNYYKPGAASKVFHALKAEFDNFPGTQQYYCKGNFIKGYAENVSASNNGCVNSGNPDPWVTSPFFPSFATIHSATEAYKHVLSDVGATLPAFDEHDQRIVRETWMGTTSVKGSVTGVAGLPDHQDDVGGYEHYPVVYRPDDFDTDGDGMPDWWEKVRGVSEANADPDEDGYTNLEDYLNWMAEPFAFVDAQRQAVFNLNALSRGFQNGAHYLVESDRCAFAAISDSVLSVTSSGSCPLFRIAFSVTDAEGSTLTRTVGIVDSTARAVENQPPYFVSADTFSVKENILQVGQVQAKDPEGAAITYALSASSDSALFQINPATGMLTFLNAPDYENPQDNGFNNIHHLMISVSDGLHVVSRRHIVIVTDVDEVHLNVHESRVLLPDGRPFRYWDLNGRRLSAPVH